MLVECRYGKDCKLLVFEAKRQGWLSNTIFLANESASFLPACHLLPRSALVQEMWQWPRADSPTLTPRLDQDVTTVRAPSSQHRESDFRWFSHETPGHGGMEFQTVLIPGPFFLVLGFLSFLASCP